MNNLIETVISIFTVEKDVVKVLLFKKNDEPYKGYWMLPGSFLKTDETVEECINKTILKYSGLDGVYLKQSKVFSKVDRLLDKRIVAISFIGLIDPISIQLKEETSLELEVNWFDISNIPKMAYDHEDIIEANIGLLRDSIGNIDILKKFFPSDFTLPELQRVYEQILNKKFDRRNFRKKFIKLIEDTGYKNEGFSGRPAKLYRFIENIEERELF